MNNDQGFQQVVPLNQVAPADEDQGSETSSGITLDHLVDIAIEQDASDIHFAEGSRIALRVGGKFVFIENVNRLSKADAELIVKTLLPNEPEWKRFQTLREMDFSFVHSSGVSFRANVYYSRGKLTGSMRMISKHLPTMDDLGIPPIMKSFLSLREGLVLVAGTTGSGKSTSIQAMLEYVNENFVYHVVTIENPIEHIFKEDKSIFSQREMGKDTLTFINAMHSAAREDPNIIMISEIPDKMTMDAVLNLVEMGHLVVVAMPTKNALQTIEHILAMYPHGDHEIARGRLAEALSVIMAQDLLDRIDQPGRIAIFEILIGSKAVKYAIRHDTLSQLRTTMESSVQDGMMTMDAYAYQLAEHGIIAKGDVEQYIPSQD